MSKLHLVAALNRSRLRRSIAVERARLNEMRENANELIDAQHCVVLTAERRLNGGPGPRPPSARDIAREIERSAKAPLFA
jgi:hypothetical protein